MSGATRRGLFAGAAGLAAVTAAAANAAQTSRPPAASSAIEPFHGEHQGGIATPQQNHSYFAVFDLTTARREDVVSLLRVWTDAAARLTEGRAGDEAADPAAAPTDSGEAVDLAPARLTLTFGFGPSLFVKDGADRYGLAAHRPEALVDLPKFVGDQLVPARTGGDLAVQACADSPQVCFHAVRQLTRLAQPWAQIRWVQNGFLAGHGAGQTPRNLMGFKDGTINVATHDPAVMDQFVWVGEEGGWMKGGSYMVARPIRISLEHWDRMTLAFQEKTVGRHKATGATLGGKDEFGPLDLTTLDAEGNPLTPENCHARLAAPAANDGAQILRRAYSYDNGVSFVAERWPPWRQGLEMDAGLMFVCHQRDPRTGFIKIFDKMSKFDMMNQFVTPIGGGLFACPAGVKEGGYIGQALFETT